MLQRHIGQNVSYLSKIIHLHISFWKRHIFLQCFQVNSLGPSDAIWRQRSGSTVAQVMACCLMAPSHYQNQCWLIISKVEWHSSKGNFTRDTSAVNHWNCLKNWVPKMSFKFPRGQWVNCSLVWTTILQGRGKEKLVLKGCYIEFKN